MPCQASAAAHWPPIPGLQQTAAVCRPLHKAIASELCTAAGLFKCVAKASAQQEEKG